MSALGLQSVAAGQEWQAVGLPWEWGAKPDLWLYRDRTVAILRRYMRLSVEVGRLPSLLGREFFRSRVTSYHMSTFEDAVIFVHDVERSLERLDGFSQELIAKIVLQEYTQAETARLLGCGLRSVQRCFPEALDQLADVFLSGEILREIGPTREAEASCQEAGIGEMPASDCKEGKNIF